ncbi:MAG: 1-acyl-sn-glycerol-3-phosphate acyltransferase [Acidobacteria bacterium]|nr:1-acyl-sn-glycerol-3-phosphate acyltransferase [Acidobacteriota bacterium]
MNRSLRHQSNDRCKRWLIRGILIIFGKRILSVEGWHWLDSVSDPFLIAINHSQRLEALLLPTLLFWYREGRLIHFLADWNFILNPIVAFGYWKGEVIPVTRKPARPRILSGLRSWVVSTPHGYDRARKHLQAGRSVGIFPEGTTNRQTDRMLTGHTGAARLSLEAECPVIPVGIRFPKAKERGWVSPWDRMQVSIGPPLHPPPSTTPAPSAEVKSWHEEIMRAISVQSGKSWSPRAISPRH